RGRDGAAEAQLLEPGPGGVHQREQADERDPMGVDEVDVEAILGEEPQPAAGRDAGQVVVPDAPAVLELLRHGKRGCARRAKAVKCAIDAAPLTYAGRRHDNGTRSARLGSPASE